MFARLVWLMLVLGFCFSTEASARNSLRGSPESMERQNAQADKDDLSRLSEKHLQYFKNRGLLVPLPESKTVVIDSRLPEKYRWCRPCTRKFLIDLGERYYERFGRPIQVNSAVRTMEYQAQLRGRNGNAASHHPGPRQSSHLTGATIDIGKLPMSSLEELQWMRRVLASLSGDGKIDAVEEHRQLVFHVMVFKKYCAPAKKKAPKE